MILILYISIICYLPIVDRFLPTTNFGEGIPDIGAVRLFSYLLFLLFFIHCAITKKLSVLYKWIGILAVYYLFAFVSISWSNYSYNTGTLQEFFNEAFMPVFLVLVALNLFQKEENVKIYIICISITSLIMSIMSVGQMVLGSSMVLGQARSTGTFGNPNSLANFLVLTIPCIMYGLEKRLMSRGIYWIVSFSLVSGILCTVSRKGIITMVLSFCLYNMLKKQYRKVFFTVSIFMILAVAFSGYSVITQRFEPEEVKNQLKEKWGMTYAGLKMFKNSPVIGLGYQGYFDNFGNYYPELGKNQYDAHNIFITALANYGTLGFIIFLAIFFHPLLAAAEVIRGDEDPVDSSNFLNDMAIICICSVIPFMIAGWFSGALLRNVVTMSLFYNNISLFFAARYRERLI